MAAPKRAVARAPARQPAPEIPPGALAVDAPLLIGRSADHAAIRLRQFDAPEDDFAWSMGRFAEVEFGAEVLADAPCNMVLDIDVFRVPPVLAGQHVLVYLNGLRVHSAFVASRTVLEIALRPDWLVPEDNRLTFDLPDAIRPLEFGMDDSRMLGLKLFSIALENTGY